MIRAKCSRESARCGSRIPASLKIFYQKGAQPLIVPAAGKVFAYCYLDPEHPPETIMLQFHTNGWKHRAVWGDESKIDFGKPGTAEKVLMGELPETGKWVRLVVNAKQMGLTSGKKVTGFAFTQFGGTVTWDHLGISAIVDRRKDITWSWKQWKKQKGGKAKQRIARRIASTGSRETT